MARIGREIASGLSAAHRQGLIHRDIKPDNIWLDAKAGRAKILDFGLARSHEVDSGLTQTGVVVGTPRYMAPEQATGETVDHRSDLFSLGSVLYHSLSGVAPFAGSNLTGTLIKVAQADYRPIETECPGLNQEFADLITRLLSKDPETRPQSAEQVWETLSQLERTLDLEKQRQLDETIDSEAVAAAIRSDALTTPPRRRSRMFAGGLVGGLLLLFGIVLMIPTKEGKVRIKVLDNQAEVFLASHGDKITSAAEEELLVTTDRRDKLRIRRGDVEFFTDDFELKQGEDVLIRIEYLSGQLQVAKDGTRLSLHPSPNQVATDRKTSRTSDRQPIAELLESSDYEWTSPEVLGEHINIGSYTYAPWVSEDGLELWFTSNLGPEKGLDDIHIARRVSHDTKWEQVTHLGDPINTRGYESEFTLTRDRLELVVQRNGKLFHATRASIAAPWSEPATIEELNRLARSPVFADEGQTLYFSFNEARESNAFTDPWNIYRISRERRGAGWSSPRPIQELNSETTDFADWVSADGRLMLLESTRDGGIGDFDFWYASRPSRDAPWGQPTNLGSPINSPQREASLWLAEDGTTILFGSFRPGGRGFANIYVSRRVPESGSTQSSADVIRYGTHCRVAGNVSNP